MKNQNSPFSISLRTVSVVLLLSLLLLPLTASASPESWSGIEPLKSTRADVEKALGKPIGEPGPNGELRFKVAGGTVDVYFTGAHIVEVKKLHPKFEGTVLEIVLKHDSSSDTPESLDLTKKKDFEHEHKANVDVYRNLREGISYTFIDGKLRTTRYAASTEQLSKARKG
ncbi:MAG: hypothetical protein QOH96_778 [Blastocatellia bacterium]|nr:hypothetical protein [Blastocatellia bacterium]